MATNKVTVVNHGSQFGHKNWYTFHCPHCRRQITRYESPDICEHCGVGVIWKNPRTKPPKPKPAPAQIIKQGEKPRPVGR